MVLTFKWERQEIKMTGLFFQMTKLQQNVMNM